MKFKISITLLLITVCFLGFGQNGPNLPCPDCEQNFTQPIPYEGSWYNPDQSGSGFLFDVQNNIIVGYYFGYDAEGMRDWALFSGQLEDASEEGALWKVSAGLQQPLGGNCLNCAYIPPTHNEPSRTIEVTFNRLTHATFSVDGGEPQNIVPLYFGYSFAELPAEASRETFMVPELEGWWTIFIDENDMQPGPDAYSYSSFIVNISKGRLSNNGTLTGALTFSTTYYPRPPEVIGVGSIRCQVIEVNQVNQPKCEYNIVPLTLKFNISPANISSNHIYGETSDGDKIEMIRISSDHCNSPATPENCINTGIFD